MGLVSRYWRLIRLDGTGKVRVEEVAIAKSFFLEQFAHLSNQSEGSDSSIQRQLALLWKGEEATRYPAEACLRCYISQQIEQVCLQLEAQFGHQHGFNRYDLFPFVLDDDGRWIKSQRITPSSRSFATEILQTFDPSRAGLSTWVSLLVRHHRDLNQFLLEQGVYLVSDWAILNDTTPKQLARIFAEFHSRTPAEIQSASHLLQGYHQIYRQDRLKQRQSGVRGQCPPPNLEQLQKIAESVAPFFLEPLTPEEVMSQLQAIALQLRQYRIYVRGGQGPTESLDQPENQATAAKLQLPERDDAQAEQQEFLAVYRQQFLDCLDHVMELVVGDRLSHMQRKNPQTAHQFLTALTLFHCRGQSMGEIASQIGLKAQYQVTRLMKLKEFRADVRQHLLRRLCDRIGEMAQAYTDPQRLHTLNQTLETALDEQVSTLIQQAENEASIAKHQPLDSLFARRLCHHLDTRSIEA